MYTHGLTSRFVPMDVSYPDVSYPLSVGSYPTLWSIRTQEIMTKFLEFLSVKLVKTVKMQRLCVILFVILLIDLTSASGPRVS